MVTAHNIEKRSDMFVRCSIQECRIIDGTGSPWYYGEVAVKDDEIKEVSYRVKGEAKKVIDGKNMVLSPGFIDSHSHSDTCWFADNRGESKIRQELPQKLRASAACLLRLLQRKEEFGHFS